MTDHHHLHAHDLSVVIEVNADGLPRVLHFGPALPELTGADLSTLAKAISRQTAPGTLDAAWNLSLFPQEGDGFTGRPGMQLTRNGRLHHPRWQVENVTTTATRMQVTAVDEVSGARLDTTLEIETGSVLWVEATITHHGEGAALGVDWIEPTMPVPTSTSHLTTFDGRWTREKRPVTLPVPPGSNVRQSRRGRPGAADPDMTRPPPSSSPVENLPGGTVKCGRLTSRGPPTSPTAPIGSPTPSR